MLNLKVIWSGCATLGILVSMLEGGPPFGWAFLAIFANPFFGKLSDRTVSRAGMRRPWMVIGLVYLIVLMLKRPDRILETRRVFAEEGNGGGSQLPAGAG